MKIRFEAIVASLFAMAFAVVATAGVAAFSGLEPLLPSGSPTATTGVDPARDVPGIEPPREGVLSGRAPIAPTLEPSLAAMHSATPAPTVTAAPTPTPATEVTGIASNYPGTAGWMGEATVALPGALGGAYTGVVNGHVTVCAERCARLPVVDWCQCYWGSSDQRIVDLSHPAWSLVSDAPLAEGLIEVRLLLER